MRKLLFLLIAMSLLSAAAVSTIGCSKGSDDGKGKDSGGEKKPSATIIGKWKLVEREEDALPNLRTIFRGPPNGTIFEFKKDKSLIVTRNLLEEFKLKDIFPTKKKEAEGQGIGIKLKGSYKLKDKKITIELPNLLEPQEARVTTLTDTDLVLTDEKKKSMKFKRQS